MIELVEHLAAVQRFCACIYEAGLLFESRHMVGTETDFGRTVTYAAFVREKAGLGQLDEHLPADLNRTVCQFERISFFPEHFGTDTNIFCFIFGKPDRGSLEKGGNFLFAEEGLLCLETDTPGTIAQSLVYSADQIEHLR